MIRRKKITTCIAMALLAASCALPPAVERAAVTVAVMKYIERGEDRAHRAAEIREVTASLVRYLDFDAATVADLGVLVTRRIESSDLDTADRVLAYELRNLIVDTLTARVGSGELDPDAVIQVSDVLGWVNAATEYYP